MGLCFKISFPFLGSLYFIKKLFYVLCSSYLDNILMQLTIRIPAVYLC